MRWQRIAPLTSHRESFRALGVAELRVHHSNLLVKTKGQIMNWDTIEGKWKQVTGQIKQKWAKLTDDDLTAVNGKRDELVGKLQERYGMAKDDAERELKDFETHCNC
jgi:uncharacterized protein YjbJ (UPF0337 family)